MNMFFRTIAGNVGYVEFYKESSNLKNCYYNESYKGPMQNYFRARIYILPLMVANAMERDPIKLIAGSLLRATLATKYLWQVSGSNSISVAVTKTWYDLSLGCDAKWITQGFIIPCRVWAFIKKNILKHVSIPIIYKHWCDEILPHRWNGTFTLLSYAMGFDVLVGAMACVTRTFQNLCGTPFTTNALHIYLHEKKRHKVTFHFTYN